MTPPPRAPEAPGSEARQAAVVLAALAILPLLFGLPELVRHLRGPAPREVAAIVRDREVLDDAEGPPRYRLKVAVEDGEGTLLTQEVTEEEWRQNEPGTRLTALVEPGRPDRTRLGAQAPPWEALLSVAVGLLLLGGAAALAFRRSPISA